MSTGTVARRLIELCRAGQFDRALNELYADARSIEKPGDKSQAVAAANTLAALRRNGRASQDDCVKIHSVLVSDPLIAGPFFTVAMGLDATYRDGARRSIKEVCVYEVRNDKIIREQSFCS